VEETTIRREAGVPEDPVAPRERQEGLQVKAAAVVRRAAPEERVEPVERPARLTAALEKPAPTEAVMHRRR
jgi:hypothetical protein